MSSAGPGGDMQWCFSQVKGAIDDDVAEGMKPVMFPHWVTPSGALRLCGSYKEHL
uniref:Uncharacterized protein n=1 Tax=Periophthalmus magnuspinnatus TaxID=409849 RepID=A0A3B4AKJ7_9GOBI